MPQFDASFYGSQIFWLVVSLSFIFFYCRYFFIPKLECVVSHRHSFIEKQYARAQQFEERTQSLVEVHATQMKQAEIQSRILLMESIKKLDQQKKEQHKILDDSISDAVTAFKRELAMEKETVLSDFDPLIVDFVDEIRRKIGVTLT